MDATIVPKLQKHYPVLLKEIISVISPQRGGTFIDCTFGQGGYTKKILDFKNTNVIAIDRDKESEKIAIKLKENFEDRFIFKNIKFSQLSNLKLKNENSSPSDLLNSEDQEDEDDLEIPAFLRRQKN